MTPNAPSHGPNPATNPAEVKAGVTLRDPAGVRCTTAGVNAMTTRGAAAKTAPAMTTSVTTTTPVAMTILAATMLAATTPARSAGVTRDGGVVMTLPAGDEKAPDVVRAPTTVAAGRGRNAGASGRGPAASVTGGRPGAASRGDARHSAPPSGGGTAIRRGGSPTTLCEPWPMGLTPISICPNDCAALDSTLVTPRSPPSSSTA